jgi:hypothetical protein
MPCATIEYMNARRAHKPASGGAQQNHRVEYCPDDQLEPAEIAYHKAMGHISDFALWAEATRIAQANRLGIPQTEPETEIPF